MDAVLNSLRLRKRKTPGEGNFLSCSKEYLLDPLKSVSAVVQVVPRDMFLHLFDECSPCRAKAEKVSDGIESRTLDQFCVGCYF